MLEIVGMTAKDVNWDLSTVQKNCGNQYALSVNRIKGSQIKFGAEEWSPESSEKAVSDRGCPKQRGSQLESSRDAQPSGVLPGPRCPDISKRKARGCASIWQRLPGLSRRSDVDRQPWASQKKISLHLRRGKSEDCEMQYGLAFFFPLSLKNVMGNQVTKRRPGWRCMLQWRCIWWLTVFTLLLYVTACDDKNWTNCLFYFQQLPCYYLDRRVRLTWHN